ncbi:MAG: phosphate regulon sensor histidine kinase PhoR [Steroidobacteraceae bacterium]
MKSASLSRLQSARFSGIAWQLVYRVLAVLGMSLLVGRILGNMGWWVALGLGVYLLWQLRNLWELDRWVRFRSVLHPPDFGGPWGELTTVIARIYRRKQFHKQRVGNLLREFRRLTASMPDGAALLGNYNELLWFNQRAERWLGLRRKRDVGIRIENLVRYPAFVRYLERGDYSHSVTVLQPGAQQRWLSFHLVQAEGSTQKLLIVRDITKEMRIEAMRKDFVANASHELRSPLTVISGYLDSLADDTELNALWQAPVQEMRRQSERMRTLIEELLQLSRLENSGELTENQCVDVPGLLALLRKDVLTMERRPKDITLQIETDVCLLGSETELQSVFVNLISNAVKYTPVEGSVTIRWWRDAEGAHLSVSDTGVGIAAEHLPRLTERFYRVDAGRSREMGGFGLGLSIVKHALQRHGATLSIESEPGKGSTFTCHFPPERITTRIYPAAAGSRS